MRNGIWLMALVTAVCAFGLMSSCTSMARRIEAFTNYATKPVNKQDCQAMLILAKTERDGIEGRKRALEDLKAVYPKLDNTDTTKTLSEMAANIAWLDDQVKQLEALLPTLPDNPSYRVVEPTPTPAPAQ